jgi:hypothetical protein
MCTEQLPLGGYPIAVKYIASNIFYRYLISDVEKNQIHPFTHHFVFLYIQQHKFLEEKKLANNG